MHPTTTHQVEGKVQLFVTILDRKDRKYKIPSISGTILCISREIAFTVPWQRLFLATCEQFWYTIEDRGSSSSKHALADTYGSQTHVHKDTHWQTHCFGIKRGTKLLPHSFYFDRCCRWLEAKLHKRKVFLNCSYIYMLYFIGLVYKIVSVTAPRHTPIMVTHQKWRARIPRER